VTLAMLIAAVYVYKRLRGWQVRLSWRTLIIGQLFIISFFAALLQVRYDVSEQIRFAGVDKDVLTSRARPEGTPRGPYFLVPDGRAYREDVPASAWRILTWPQVWATAVLYVALVLSIVRDRALPSPRRGGSGWRRFRRGQLPKGSLPETGKWATARR